MKKGTLRVRIEWEGKTFEFTGRPTQVSSEIQTLLVKTIPELSLAQELILSFDARDLAEIIAQHISVTPENEIILKLSPSSSSLSDRILCVLVAQKFLLLSGRAENDYLPLRQLAANSLGSPKSSSSRLSELIADGLVEKQRDRGAVSYRVTIRGILHFKSSRAPRLQ